MVLIQEQISQHHCERQNTGILCTFCRIVKNIYRTSSISSSFTGPTAGTLNTSSVVGAAVKVHDIICILKCCMFSDVPLSALSKQKDKASIQETFCCVSYRWLDSDRLRVPVCQLQEEWDLLKILSLLPFRELQHFQSPPSSGEKRLGFWNRKISSHISGWNGFCNMLKIRGEILWRSSKIQDSWTLPRHFHRILLTLKRPTKSLQDHSSLLITYLLPLPIISSGWCLLSGLLIPPTGEPSSGITSPVFLPAQKKKNPEWSIWKINTTN